MTIAAIVVAMVAWLGTTDAFAANFTVTRTDDPTPDGCAPGDCSLREAVMAANAANATTSLSSKVRLVLPEARYELAIPPGENGDLDLYGTTGDLDIFGLVTVETVGGVKATIDANGIDRIFHIPPTMPDDVEADFRSCGLKVEGITLTGGLPDSVSATPDGGAILVDASGPGSPRDEFCINNTGLRLEHVVFRNNASPGNGGAIATVDADETVVDKSRVSGNTASGSGGAIWSRGGNTFVRESRVDGNRAQNHGGAVAIGEIPGMPYPAEGVFAYQHLYVSRSTIEGNRAMLEGGAVSAVPGSDNGSTRPVFHINFSTINQNRAGGNGGGISRGRLDLRQSTVHGNRSVRHGGGVFITAPNGEMNIGTVAMATIVGNRGKRGGGIYLDGPVPSMYGVLLAKNRLVTGRLNDCGGDTFKAVFEGTLVRNNLASTAGPSPKSLRCKGWGAGKNNLVRKNPRIGKLARNGGPTKSIALLPGSPALDRGFLHRRSLNDCGETNPECRDQRGRKRRAVPDIGAIEARKKS